MTVNSGPPPTSDSDLFREQVIAIYRAAETDALRRHTGLVGSDGLGHLKVICGCELTYRSTEEWTVHLQAVVAGSRRPRPTKR